MVIAQAVAAQGEQLSKEKVLETLQSGLGNSFRNQRVLVLIPDHTRSLPLPFLFRTLVDLLHEARQLDFMVALGTQSPLKEEHLNQLVGITAEERASSFKKVGLLNHAWNTDSALKIIGTLEQDEIRQIAGSSWHPSLPDRVEIRINQAALEHDHILILGPTFPHEVVGFSGGLRYLFPGIADWQIINFFHPRRRLDAYRLLLRGLPGRVALPERHP